MNPTCSWFGQDGPHSNRLTLTNCLFTRARKLPSSSTSPVSSSLATYRSNDRMPRSNPGSLRWARASANVTISVPAESCGHRRPRIVPAVPGFRVVGSTRNCSSGCSGEQVSGGSPCDCARISCPCGWQITYDPERPSTAWRVPARTRGHMLWGGRP